MSFHSAKPIRPAACALAAGLALALAACGDDDETSAKPLTKQEFTSRGNAACNRSNARIHAIEQPSEIGEVAAYADATGDVERDLRASLRKLTPPAEDQAGFDRTLATLDEAIKDIERAKAAAEDGDAAQVKKLGDEISDSAFGDQAHKVGLVDCE